MQRVIIHTFLRVIVYVSLFHPSIQNVPIRWCSHPGDRHLCCSFFLNQTQLMVNRALAYFLCMYFGPAHSRPRVEPEALSFFRSILTNAMIFSSSPLFLMAPFGWNQLNNATWRSRELSTASHRTTAAFWIERQPSRQPRRLGRRGCILSAALLTPQAFLQFGNPMLTSY